MFATTNAIVDPVLRPPLHDVVGVPDGAVEVPYLSAVLAHIVPDADLLRYVFIAFAELGIATVLLDVIAILWAAGKFRRPCLASGLACERLKVLPEKREQATVPQIVFSIASAARLLGVVAVSASTFAVILITNGNVNPLGSFSYLTNVLTLCWTLQGLSFRKHEEFFRRCLYHPEVGTLHSPCMSALLPNFTVKTLSPYLALTFQGGQYLGCPRGCGWLVFYQDRPRASHDDY